MAFFENYTEKSRRVVFFARYEAGQLGSEYIEPEHILLGLLREDRRLLNQVCSEPGNFRESILAMLAPSARPISSALDLPLSSASKLSLEAAAKEAEISSSKVISTEHLLLGVLRNLEGRPVSGVLAKHRVSYAEVRVKLFDPQFYLERMPVRSTSLRLSDMHLTRLPEQIARFFALKTLDVSHNQLVSLPDWIGELQDLENLNVSFNALIELPTVLLRMKSLKRLDVRENPDLDLPPELSKMPADSQEANAQLILGYYFQKSSPLNEAKLVLVGRGGVGKTSLVRRLIYGEFDPEEKETPGINIAEWELRLPRKRAVRLHSMGLRRTGDPACHPPILLN